LTSTEYRTAPTTDLCKVGSKSEHFIETMKRHKSKINLTLQITEKEYHRDIIPNRTGIFQTRG
jgi:hypothetical protein